MTDGTRRAGVYRHLLVTHDDSVTLSAAARNGCRAKPRANLAQGGASVTSPWSRVIGLILWGVKPGQEQTAVAVHRFAQKVDSAFGRLAGS
jgi:hypothetical protein